MPSARQQLLTAHNSVCREKNRPRFCLQLQARKHTGDCVRYCTVDSASLADAIIGLHYRLEVVKVFSALYNVPPCVHHLQRYSP